MSGKTEVDLRDIARVVATGTVSYLLVHMFLLPQLVTWGVSFPTYFYIGVLATGTLAVVFGLIFRPRSNATPERAEDMIPAE